MLKAEAVVVNRLGLHARPSARLTATASKFRSEVWLSKGSRRINAKSIMGVMMLAAERDSVITVRANGKDEAAAVDALAALVARGFDE